MNDNQRYWTRAEKMSFRWKRWRETTDGPVSKQRRENMAKSFYEIFLRHGDEEML